MLMPALLLVLACLAAAGCLLFTTPVNAPPTVRIVPPTAPINRGQMIKIVAAASDPDGDAVRLDWSTLMGECKQPLDPRPVSTFTSPPGDPSFPFTFAPGDATKVCVFVLATDPAGATALDAITVSSIDRPPVAAITVLEPSTKTSSGLFELYSVLHLSAASSQDPDGDAIKDPMFQLVIFPPAAMPTPKLVPCPSEIPNELVTCLDVGGFAGTYTVTLSVGDGDMRSLATQLMLGVDQDHPACVKATDPATSTSPLILDPGEAKTLTITQILDDGAPLPTPPGGAPARPTFAWTVRRNGGAWQPIVGYQNVNALTLPENTYATGDVVDVNVTISDGVAMHLQPACDPRCPAGCPQAAQWTVAYR